MSPNAPERLRGPLVVRGQTQDYAWGDPSFIPQLLGIERPQGPYAELWLGTHPALPAQVVVGERSVPMDRFVAEHRDEVLGHGASGALPFLLKVLAADKPLSIQVHPNREQALAGFRAAQRPDGERAARTYRDDNHKPELLVALTQVTALAGFRPLETIAGALAGVPEIASLLPPCDGSSVSLRALLRAYFALSQAVLTPAHEALIARLEGEEIAAGGLSEQDPRYWVLVAHREHGVAGQADRGLLFVFLLNLVHLAPGEALYMPAGMPHAYLHGAGVEVMASSDNVLRCGLTQKHVDPDEMLHVLDVRGVRAPVISPQVIGDQRIYRTPAVEFELSSIDVGAGSERRLVVRSPELLLVVGGGGRAQVAVEGPGGQIELSTGQACLLLPGEEYRVATHDSATIFRAKVPTASKELTFRGSRPRALTFGTSGLRGLINDITDLEAYINTRGFLDFVRALGEVADGDEIILAGDLRPSTDSPERSILRAVTKAILDAGFQPLYVGRIPTPALTFYGIERGRPSVMVTGSHIPFDRNGIKFNRAAGEVLKADESAILTCVARVREEVYTCPQEASPFADDGMLRDGQRPPLPPASAAALDAYRARYENAFPKSALSGQRVVVYEHSAVGRELLAEILRALGAEVIPMGRVSGFVAIDTEALAPQTLPELQRMVAEASAKHGPVDAVVSTDGDSDRPLVLGVDGAGQVRFVSGDLLGILVARYLRADAVAVPVSATDAVERALVKDGVQVRRTRIGSPHVIAAMGELEGERVVGWEANGGFLVGSTIEGLAEPLAPLPTRDAVLPICAVLHQAKLTGGGIVGLLEQLPPRYTAAGLLDEVDPLESGALLRLLGAGLGVDEAEFEGEACSARASDGAALRDPSVLAALQEARALLHGQLPSDQGYGHVQRINYTDGVRAYLSSGDIVHLRPSGNAPQLRVYVVTDTQARAQAIVEEGLREPDGLLRRLLAVAKQEAYVAAVARNIDLTAQLFREGDPAAVIGTVSGSNSAQAFWQSVLDRSRKAFRARAAISFHEDLPVNQALGILLLWQRLRPSLADGEGALVAFVFGEGTRATPLTETDNGQKPAILSYVQDEQGEGGPGFLSMVELALRYFAPVESYLRRSGFEGLVVKWGDEVQIPTRDLSGSDPRLATADVVRFVSMRPMNASDAANKDWVGVDREGRVTAFIPRRPLAEMESLADRGLLERRDGVLWGGVNLGSIAMSRRLLDALHAEFDQEINDPSANRKSRPDLDPQLFTALTIATLPTQAARTAAFVQACAESPAMAKLAAAMPDVLARLSAVVEGLKARDGRPVEIVALDFEDQYWGDIGQHRQMHDFYMALAADSPEGRIARRLAGLPETCDSHGNRLIGEVHIAPDAEVRNSVLIHAHVDGKSRIEGSVLIGSQLRDANLHEAFDVLSVNAGMCLPPRAGAYRVLSQEPVVAQPGERLTTLFLPDAPALFRVHEDTDLRDRATTYDKPIAGNPTSFAAAHTLMSAAGATEVQERRVALRRKLLE